MHAILSFLRNMLPFQAVGLLLYVIARAVCLSVQKKTFRALREVCGIFLTLSVIGILSQAVLPKIGLDQSGITVSLSGVHTTNLIPFRVFYDTAKEVFVNGKINAFLINFLGNIVLFIPVGFCVPLLWHTKAGKTALCGFSLSLFIEICQLFLPRSTDVDDLLLNTLGTLAGYLLCRFILRRFPQMKQHFEPV